MKSKSLSTFVRILLLGLLLGTSSSVYADAISITSATVSNIQLVPTSGTIMFFSTESPPATRARAVVTDGFIDVSQPVSNPLRSQASVNLNVASASAVSDLTNLSLSANSNVMLSECFCSFESEGLAVLRQSFIIVGGSGNVNVNLSALLMTTQTLMTDQFGLFAASDALITLQVLDAGSFSFDSRLRIPPSDSTALDRQRQLSEVITLQFDKEYTLFVTAIANSRGAQNGIPEPASVFLLVSGLGFMAGFAKRYRRYL
jgi:hypothetical protein